MPTLLLRSIQPEFLGMGLRYCHILKTSQVTQMCPQIFHPLIQRDWILGILGILGIQDTSQDLVRWAPLLPALHSCSGCWRQKFPAQHHIKQFFCWWWYFFPCTLWVFIAIASPLLSTDLPLTAVGCCSWSLECTVESSLELLEREFCPELVTHTRV